MANVPNVPGVPALPSYTDAIQSLVVADALNVLSAVLPSQWGIYLDGAPVITPATQLTQAFASTLAVVSQIASIVGLPNIVPVIASTIDFEYMARSPLSNYTQQAGAFEQYNKVQLPAEITTKIACGGSPSQRAAFLNTLEALRTSTVLVDIVTPEQAYTSYNCSQYNFRRHAESGVTLITAEVHFELVPVTASANFSNTQQPGNAGAQAVGNVQPSSAPATVSDRIDAAGGVN
jgi:hypothetical protein